MIVKISKKFVSGCDSTGIHGPMHFFYLGEARKLLKTPSTPDKTRKAKGHIAYLDDTMKDLPDFLPDFEGSDGSPSSEGEEESDFSDIEESDAVSWRQVHRNSRLRLNQRQYHEERNRWFDDEE